MDLTDDDLAIIRRVAASVGRARWVPRDDLVQEAVMALLLVQYDPSRCERGAFVAAVSKQAMIDWLRVFFRVGRRGKQPPQRVEFQGDDFAEPGREHAWSAADAKHDARVLLSRCTESANRILRMHYLEGIQLKQCARKLGLTESGVSWILRDGMFTRPARRPGPVPKRRDNRTVPLRPPVKTPDDLRAIVPDMPAFLASLPPVSRADTTAWLAGDSVQDIALRERVRPNTVQCSINKAISRARFAASDT